MDDREHLGGFLYISNRMVSAILNMPEVRKPRKTLGVEKLGAEISATPKATASFSPKDYVETLENRALRATREVRAQTGSLSDPAKPYLRLRLDAYIGTFSVPNGWNWEGIPTEDYTQSVMLLAASQTMHGQRVFVGLIGSAHNLIQDGVKAPVKHTQGRTPSDVNGLYDLFSQIRETQDAEPDEHRVSRDHSLSELDIAKSTMALAQGSPGDGPPRRVELLMQRHLRPIQGDEVRLDQNFLDPYNLVLIGAPVWIREVTASSGTLSQPLMDKVGHPEHQLFSEARLKSLSLAHRASATNVQLTAIIEEFDAQQKADSEAVVRGDEISHDTSILRSRIAETFDALENLLEELRKHESETIDRATSQDQWPKFAEWYSIQASLQGIPFVSLEVERERPWWQRIFQRDRDDQVPQKTEISGVVVTIFSGPPPGDCWRLDLGFWRSAQYRDLIGGYPQDVKHVLVTPQGEIYPVTIWTHRWNDLRARVVYDNRKLGSAKLRSWEDPVSTPELIAETAKAMLEDAMRWRVTLKRGVPESPWIYESVHERLRQYYLQRRGMVLKLPDKVPNPVIEKYIEDVTIDVDLDVEADLEVNLGDELGEDTEKQDESITKDLDATGSNPEEGV